MISKILFHKNKILVLFLFIFSVFINQYYGNRGVFPIDSFHFFDSGYRILNGDIPFTDYWLVKGPLIDYVAAFFFYVFGVNWQSYVLHASLINSLITVSTFFILKNFKLKISYCFLYSLLFSILAYPSSGTPFIVHHSAFFSLLGIYSLLLAIKNEKNIYWVLAPILLIVAFLSKQVPAAYVILFVCFVLSLYILINKRLYFIKYSFSGLVLFILIILIFGKYQGIVFSSFLDQYILYPKTIGLERYQNFNLTFQNFVGHYKFVYLAIAPLLYENIKKIIFNNNYLKSADFYIFLLLFFFTFSLIFHQLLTKNQIFIFFLIPILTGFSQISLNKSKYKFKNAISYILILICIFATFKYHLRFNENRKFHELNNVNFELSIDAKKIHKKFSGLNWITPEFKEKPQEEINLINQALYILSKDPRKKMVVTNYSFFSAILEQKLFAPSRVYTSDGTTHPLKGNKYESKYKKLMDNLITKNNISVVYFINMKTNFHYIDLYQHCFKETTLQEKIKTYEIKDCI